MITIGSSDNASFFTQPSKQNIYSSDAFNHITFSNTQSLSCNCIFIFQSCNPNHISIESKLIYQQINQQKGGHSFFLKQNIVVIPHSCWLFLQQLRNYKIFRTKLHLKVFHAESIQKRLWDTSYNKVSNHYLFIIFFIKKVKKFIIVKSSPPYINISIINSDHKRQSLYKDELPHSGIFIIIYAKITKKNGQITVSIFLPPLQMYF